MAKYKCNSCGATYSDATPKGGRYFHACSPEVIEYATFDTDGKQLTQEKRTPRENIRDESGRTDLVERGGKIGTIEGSTQLEGGEKFIPVDSVIVSEGLGRTLIE